MLSFSFKSAYLQVDLETVMRRIVKKFDCEKSMSIVNKSCAPQKKNLFDIDRKQLKQQRSFEPEFLTQSSYNFGNGKNINAGNFVVLI